MEVMTPISTHHGAKLLSLSWCDRCTRVNSLHIFLVTWEKKAGSVPVKISLENSNIMYLEDRTHSRIFSWTRFDLASSYLWEQN